MKVFIGCFRNKLVPVLLQLTKVNFYMLIKWNNSQQKKMKM